MGMQVNVSGACLVKVDNRQGPGLQSLGYGENSIGIEEEVFSEGVPGDENGGDAGPPIDVQYFGELHRVRMELSKWDPAIATTVLSKVNNGTAGVLAQAGSLMAAGNLAYRLLLLPTVLPRNYLQAFLRGAPTEINKGTKYSRLVLNWECHANGVGGTIYNTVIT